MKADMNNNINGEISVSDIKKTDIKKDEKSIPTVKISVIIPVYNAEKYLKDCLDSVIRQTYKNLEIICINDGSTDHSLDILRMYEKKDDRIKVIDKENEGPSSARNAGIDAVTGDFVSFVDADDYLQLNSYEILAECAEQEQKWDLIIFGGNVVGMPNEYIQDKLTTVFNIYENTAPGDVVFREKAARPFLWLHFIRRELFEKPSKIRFDSSMKLGEDQIFQFCYVPRAKNVMVIDQKLYNYRIEQNSSLMQLFSNRRIQKTECHFKIIEKVIFAWEDMGYYEAYKDDLWSWAVGLIYWTIVDFPSEFKKEFSERMIEMMNKYNVELWCLSCCEREHYKSFQEWMINDITAEEELNQLIEKIDREKYEIDETLKSKAYKLGKLLTKKL